MKHCMDNGEGEDVGLLLREYETVCSVGNTYLLVYLHDVGTTCLHSVNFNVYYIAFLL